MRASNAEEVESHVSGDPWEIFTQLVILIVEGRTPGGEKGYHAGPHCILPHQPVGNRHVCNPSVSVCSRAESFMKQLKLMWAVGVGVSVEVLLAPDCEHGAAITTAPDTTSAPSPYLRLIEQWNFTVYDRKLPEATSSGWALVAAVRSFLHFSQLSAWLSVSGGSRPPNILYRLTVTSPVFSSKFDSEPEEHVFPLANLGQDISIKAVVRALPRNREVPVLHCPQHGAKLSASESPPSSSLSTAHPTLLFSLGDVQENSVSESFPSSSGQSDASRSEEDLRRSMMKTRLSDGSRVSRSESPDTQLGESLLDPPNSLSRIPRRFQSPSRSGSPSLETPEHLICRVRQTGPSHARPPDVGAFCQPLVVPARQPLNPFPWTRTRYPTLEHSYSMAFPSATGFNLPEIFHGNAQPTSLHQASPLGAASTAPTYSHPSQFDLTKMPIAPTFQNQAQRSSSNKTPYLWSHNPSMPSHHEASPLIAQPSSSHQYFYQKPQALFSPSKPHGQPFLSRDSPKPNLVEQYSNAQSLGFDWDTADKCSKGPSFSLPKTESSFLSLPSSCSSSSSHQVTHGTKRKGTHITESPRIKRESPPRSISFDDDEEDSDYEKQFQEPDPKNAASHTKNIVNDELWPSCSQPGKHLCSSIENLAEISSKKDQEEFSSAKIKQNSASASLLKSPPRKFKFDLTPKETREILYVLRQNTPVPPLRIDQHMNSIAQQSCSCKTSSGKRSTGEDPAAASCCCSQSNVHDIFGNKMQKLEADKRTTAIRDKSLWCHKCSPDDNSLHLNIGDDLLCSNKPCDNSCKKQYSSNSLSKKIVEKPIGGIDEDGDDDDDIDDDEIEDGLSSMEIEKMKTFYPSTSATCVEAQKITQKTSFYTAISQPACKSKDIPKQVSQSLVKSPLRSVLSSIKSVSLQAKEHPTTNFEGRRGLINRVSRSLSFDCTYVDREEKVELSKEPFIAESNETPNILPHNTTSVENKSLSKDEPKESFIKSTSLLKNLIISSLASQERTTSVVADKEPRSNEKLPVSENVQCDVIGSALENGCENVNKISTIIQSNLFNRYTDSTKEIDNSEEDREVEELFQSKGIPIPTTTDKVNFRRSLDSAASLVFHNKTGLPLTSSPAPMRKGKRFDYDSSLNSVAAIGNALRTCEEEEELNENLIKEPNSLERNPKSIISISAPATVTCSNLLGSFEECVLNGRLEPVSTVQGFVAEIAASGAFCPKHITKPVTVFFYTLCDNDQISSPYMGHINLGKKGYHIPSQGTVQVTLFNPHGTVVKMFVVVYDFSDMPPNSKTFLRQRTLNMPVSASDSHPDAHQWLRYLIHLRFASSKSGKIYLHTDIRMLIFRKSDADAATLHKTNVPYELRSFTKGPSNPKFSPRK